MTNLKGKTKNDYFLDMLAEVLSWGLEPSFVTGDGWCSSVKNLNTVKKLSLGFLFAIETNRLVSESASTGKDKATWMQVKDLDIPEVGKEAWLRGVGKVKPFRTHLKNQLRHYAIHLPKTEQMPIFEHKAFLDLHNQHWQIAQYRRTIKQACNIEHFQIRSEIPTRNHVFAAICGYVQLQNFCATDLLSNCYELQRDLFKDIIASFIKSLMPSMARLESQFNHVVNA